MRGTSSSMHVDCHHPLVVMAKRRKVQEKISAISRLQIEAAKLQTTHREEVRHHVWGMGPCLIL